MFNTITSMLRLNGFGKMFHFNQIKSTFLMISLIGRHLVTRTIDQIVYENKKIKDKKNTLIGFTGTRKNNIKNTHFPKQLQQHTNKLTDEEKKIIGLDQFWSEEEISNAINILEFLLSSIAASRHHLNLISSHKNRFDWYGFILAWRYIVQEWEATWPRLRNHTFQCYYFISIFFSFCFPMRTKKNQSVNDRVLVMITVNMAYDCPCFFSRWLCCCCWIRF